MKNKCEKEIQRVEEYLIKSCAGKFNKFKSCEEEVSCPCSSNTSSNSGSVDLVILVDSSYSMSSTWKAIIDASGSLKDAIRDKCGKQARITLLSLDMVNPGSGGDAPTGFTSHEQYIIDNVGYPGPFATDDATWDGEQGSKAIADVSNHFPWKEGACRSILYVSDEWLDGIDNGEAASAASIPIGVNAANSNNVTVFTHLVSSGGSPSASNPILATHYTQLAESTGGSSHIGDKPSKKLYTNLISEAACNCGGGCLEVEAPEIKPCISISWGDSKCDSLETDDFEILCISICNCYSNIAFNNLTISLIEITDSDGNTVANLPDGTPSVQAVPIGPICFGAVAPCDEGEVSCISREFVINTRGAKEGNYQVKLHGICFEVCFTYKSTSCFEFKLCKS